MWLLAPPLLGNESKTFLMNTFGPQSSNVNAKKQ